MDISALKKAPDLVVLDISNTKIKEFQPLKELKLQELYAANTGFDRPDLLSEMPLRTLNLSGTRITSLSGINLSAMVSLDISRTDVRDLRPIAGTPVQYLTCNSTPITSFEVLKQTKIIGIGMDDPGKYEDLLLSIRTLNRVNGRNIRFGN